MRDVVRRRGIPLAPRTDLHSIFVVTKATDLTLEEELAARRQPASLNHVEAQNLLPSKLRRTTAAGCQPSLTQSRRSLKDDKFTEPLQRRSHGTTTAIRLVSIECATYLSAGHRASRPPGRWCGDACGREDR